MNHALLIARKNYLSTLIERVSDENNGDEKEFLRQVCREVIELYPDDKIEEAIACFESLV